MKRGGKKAAGKKQVYGERRIVRFILIAAVILNFLLLVPLFEDLCLVSGDGTAHYAASQAVKFRFDAGKGLFGNWNQLWAMGFPAYDYYQYFSHLLLVLLHLLSFSLIPILIIEKVLIVLAITFFPLSLYYGLRKLKLAPLPAAFASLFSFTVSSSVGFGGIGFSLVYHGLFTQLLAVFLFPIALARVYVTLSEKRSYFLSVLLLSLLLLIHPIVGCAAGVASLIFLFDRDARASLAGFFRRFARLIFVFALVFVIVSHFYIPFLLVNDYYGGAFFRSTSDYYQSSMPRVVFDFFTGKTLDFFRFPFILLTLFFFIGVYAVLSRSEKRSFPLYFALGGFIVFLLVSFGRSFWGVLFDLIPGMGYIPSSRWIFALQFFALFFVGAGFSFLFISLKKRISRMRKTIGSLPLLCVFLLILALPLFAQVLMANQKMCGIVNSGFDEEDFSKLVRFLRSAPDGRFIARPELGFAHPYFESLLPAYTARDSFSTSSIGAMDNLAFYYTTHFMLMSRDFYDLYNIRYALVPSDTPAPYSFFRQAFVAGNYTIYTIPTTGFFDFVDSTTALVYNSTVNSDFVRSANAAWLNTYAMEQKDFVTMFRKGRPFDHERYDWVIYEGSNLTGKEMSEVFRNRSKPVFTACGEIINENRTINRYVVSVLADRSCYVLFKTSYHPDWHAVVNDKEKTVYAVSPAFMAVRVSPGFSAVQFYYEDDLSFRYWLIAFGILVLLGILLYDLGSFYLR